ncbi:MAG: tRNA (guanosine(46)-N(7))-methyltransferase TrmB [Pseudobdellovibrionaceae bacterium]
MSRVLNSRLNNSKNLKSPNIYVTALLEEYNQYAYDEQTVQTHKNFWRSKIFKVGDNHPVDVEIGTGNGYYFAHRAAQKPNRSLVGLEIKYKPLIQSIRRALKNGSENARICRFHAMDIEQIFGVGEVNDVIIHHPDPWVSPRKPQNRILNRKTLRVLHGLQRPGTTIEFKTDSREYYLWALEEVADSPYEIIRQTPNLHQSEWASENFVTHFEKIFLRQGVEINYMLLRRID